MEEKLITLETAKLAKEKGFGIKQDITYILESTEEWYESKGVTQSLLQKWLREKHNIHVIIVTGYSNLPNYDCCIMFNGTNYKRSDEDFTYEEALEQGLQIALKLIKNDR